MFEKLKKLLLEIFITLIGSLIMAGGVSFFLLPNQLSTGGFSGIGTILYYLFNFPVGITIIILSLPLFVIANLKFGKAFLVKSLVGTISLSMFIDWLDKYSFVIEDKFLACIYGGIIVGIGTAIVLKAGASTGGTELISSIIHTFNPRLKLSNIIIISDFLIVGANVIFLSELEIALYSAIAIYLYGKIIDIIFEGIYYTKLVFIISNKAEEISKGIENKIKRGVTGLYGKGMYTGDDKLVLICAASRGDIAKIKILAKNIDKNSFVVIANAKEVLGEGFKNYNLV
jgi:uncharacterized membrane-anchored protein YitT (DUF2179 family)